MRRDPPSITRDKQRLYRHSKVRRVAQRLVLPGRDCMAANATHWQYCHRLSRPRAALPHTRRVDCGCEAATWCSLARRLQLAELKVALPKRRAWRRNMPRAIWSGSLGFGLVQIPVALHAAEEADELSLTLLDKRDFSPVGYERINKKTHKEVVWADTVKGYESAPGQYVVLTEHDFEEANPKSTHQIDILDFVELADIDPHYIDKPYTLVPGKNGKKAYVLLREALQRAGKAGIAKLVLRTRQHLCAVIPHGRALSLLILRFADELRGTNDLDLPDENLKKSGITSKELEMAERLIAGMVGEWDPEKYRDDYRKDLLALIHARAKAGDVNTVSSERKKVSKPKKSGKVVDLVALLAQSVASPRKGHPHAPTSHAAHSERARASGTAKSPASKRRDAHAAPHHRKSA
jgi:DNA end-binding protein Ku